MRYAILCALAAAAATAACQGASSPSPAAGAPPPSDTVTARGDSTVTFDGTIRLMGIEGGFFAIAGDDSVTYDPINLAEAYRRDGLRVRVRARLRPDLAGIHMVGPIVEILEISGPAR